MKITAKIIKELPDGSAECELRMDEEGHKFLLQAGFEAVLKSAINERKRENDIRAILAAIPKTKPKRKKVVK